MARHGSATLDTRTDHVNFFVPVVAVVVGLVLAYLVILAFVGGPIPGTDTEIGGSILWGIVALYLAPIVLFASVWAADKLVNLGKHSAE